jgi:hypothetical protein
MKLARSESMTALISSGPLDAGFSDSRRNLATCGRPLMEIRRLDQRDRVAADLLPLLGSPGLRSSVAFLR